MAITAEIRGDIIELYVAMFNAVPGTVKLSEMVTLVDGGKSIAQLADDLSHSTEFLSLYPVFITNAEFADEFINTIIPEISAAGRTEAIAVVTGLLNSGTSRGGVVWEAAKYLTALAETDANFGVGSAAFNNKVEVATYHTVTKEQSVSSVANAQTVLAGVGSSQASVDTAKTTIDTGTAPTGQSFTLTSGADAVVGTPGDDTFVATEASLSSADVLNGGNGIDTLRYASSGNAAVNESGFESTNIEWIQVTSDAVGGTSFDVTAASNVTKLINFNSSEDLALTGMDSLVVVDLNDVGSAGVTANDPTPDTMLVFNAAVVAGSADALTVNLMNNSNVDGTGIGDLTANGIETFNLVTSVGNSTINTITSASVGTINVSGDKNLTVSSNLVSADVINASTLTGNLSVVADSGAIDVVVTGGTGNDRANFSNGWDLNDSFDGGAGTDTLGLTYAVATAIVSTNSGKATNVEILDVTTAASASGTIDMDNFAGVTKVILNGGIDTGFTATIDDAVTGLEVEVDVDSVATGNLVVDLKTDGTADALTVTLDNIGAGDTIASINVEDAETVTISADDDTTDGTGTLTITSLTATDATTITLSGDSRITITDAVDPATAILTKLDASAATDNVSITGMNFASAGGTVILGSGADTYNVATSSGSDTITLGGGADKLVYNAVAQSDSDMDTVTDFVSGTDSLNFQFANPVLNFRGNQASFGQAQGSLTAGAAPGAGLDSVYQVDDQILWIDIDDNGTLDNNDFRIKLSGVTALTTADIGLSSVGNTVTLSAAAANVNTTGTPTNADKNTTNFADTINSTIARVVGSTINGALGTDTLVITDAGALAALPATITAVEVLQLASVSTTANTVAGFNAAGAFTSVTGSSNNDTITSTANLVAGGSISLNDGVDTITALAANLAGTTIDMGAGNDAITSTVGAAITTTLNGGSGTDSLTLAAGDNITGATVSNIETLTTGATATMTAAQYAGFTTVTNGGTITLTTAGTVTAVAGTFATTAAIANTFNVGVAGVTITANTGAETVKLTAAGTLAGLTFNEGAAGGTDVLEIAYDNAGAIVIPALIESAVISTTQTNAGLTLGANVLTLDTTAATNAFTLVATTAAGTSFKLGSGSDTITTVTANTAVTSIELGAGNDVVTALNVGNFAMTLDFGVGNGTITDIATHGTGVLTTKFAAPATGTTNAISVAATTANFNVGDIFDFASNVTGIISGQANGTLGVAGATGQVFVDSVTNAANTIITFDADGSRTFTTGDVQITIVGNVVTGGIDANGNFVIGASA